MKYSNTVEYNIKTSLDSKGLTQLKSELQGLELKLQNMGNKGFLDEKTFVDARNQIQGLGQALTDAFNPSLGMLDLSKLNQELKNNDVTAQGLKTAFSSLGAEGQVAFNNLAGELGKLDTGILRTNSQVDKLFTTFSNTFRWGLVSSFFSQFMNAIHSSVDYVKELDDSLTQIMLVTDYNRDSMNQFAKSANEAAKAVSMTTTGMTNASLIFAQQGYDLGQSQELATLSAKLANASQQDTATTSDQITAYMNAYGLQDSMEELTQQMDNWAKIANVSAADVGELAQASQRAASMANTVGVSGEALAAQIATIESVTREAPEQIGNGLKTLYARFSDISGGGKDEDGVDLGKVTAQLDAIGVKVLDQFGNIRTMDNIMEDLMDVWADLDDTAKIAAAQSLAGKYQVNRFVALMDNRDMYEEYIGATGSAATGTLDQMNEEFANSIEGRSAKLQASLEGLFSTIFNTDDIYPWMDAAQGAVDLLQQFFDALGGGKTVLLGISSLLMQVFSKNMAQEINNAVTNRAVQQQKLENLQNSQAALTTLGAANPNPNDANSQNILNFAQYMQANAKNFNAEQMEQANSILQELVQNSNAATMAADKLKDSLSVIGTGITATTGESILAPFLDSEGAVNATLLSEALQDMSQSEVAEMFSHIQEDIRPAREGLLEFNKALQDYQQELRNTDSTDDSWTQSLANLQAALDNLEGKIDPSTYGRYEEAVKEIAEVTENVGDKTAETTAEVAKLADGLEKVAAKDLTNLDQLNKDAFQAKNTQMAAEDSNKVAGAFQKGMDSQAQIQEILNTVNAVQQLTFAWQAFQNLGSIWSNSNLSEGEKLLQTIMALGTALPSVIIATQSLQSVMDTLIEKDKAYLQGKIEAATVTEQVELQKAQAILDTAEKSYLSAEASVNVARANVAEAQSTLALTDAKVALAKSILEEVKARALATNNMQDYALVLQAEQNLKTVQEERKQASLSLTKAQGELNAAEANAAKMGAALSQAFMGMQTAMTAYSVATGIAEGATEGFSAALTFLEKHPVIIALTAIAMAATTIFGIIKAQAEEAKQEAQAAFDEAKSHLEQIEALRDKTSAFGEKYNAFKESGEGGDELTQQARDIAQALKDAGAEEQANAIYLATLKAEAKGTAESFSTLAQEIENAQVEAEKQANKDVIKSSTQVLGNEDVLAKDVFRHQQMIKEYQEELNNLDPLDAGYEAEKERLEGLIDTLQNAKLAQEDLVNAANEYQQAQGKLAGMTVAENQGLNLYAGGQEGSRMNPESAQWFENADLDYNSINRIYSNMVDGFSDLSNLEQAQFILETIGDEAGEAAAQVELLMLSFNNLDTNQIDRLQNQMAQSGFTLEDQQLLSASLDPDTTAAEFSQTIQNIANKMSEEGTSFEIALKAEIGNPEEFQEAIRQQVESYQPLDTEIKQEDYDAMTEHFYENKDKMGEEGSGFENYSEDLFDNAEALSEVIEDTLRYSDAIDEISDNFSNWIDILDKGEKSSKDYVDAVDGLKDTFSDFLGIPEELSEEFVTTEENLKDLELAANGDVDAFDRLQTAAAIDLAEQLGVDSETAIAAVNEIQNALDTLGYDQVDIGETITFSDEALTQINSALDMLKLDADQAAQFIESAFGFKVAPGQFEYVSNDLASLPEEANASGEATAEAITVTPEVTTESVEQVASDEKNYTDVTAEISDKPWSATLPATAGGLGSITTASLPEPVPIEGTVPEVTYTAHPKTQTETKSETALATGVKGEHGGSGKPENSHVNLKPGAQGTRTGGRAPSSSAPRPSSSSGKGSCFVAGTLITTLTGFSPIEQIKQGDIVLSYNELLHRPEYSIVVQTMIHDVVEPIYTLHVKDEQLRVTGIHRFLISRDIFHSTPQWIPAADLQIGDWMFLADGTWHLIYNIEVNVEHQIVYNFEVAGNHNYYVGRNQILAHNKGRSCFVAGTLISTSLGFKPIEQIQKGDTVLSYNEQIELNEYSGVLQTMIHDTTEPIYTLYIKNEQLRVTGIHRFFVIDKITCGVPQWVHAADLHVGQWVLFADSTWHVIHKIEVNIEHQTVYNFEVSHNHNYYVGRNQILAHNKGGGNKKGGGGKGKTIEPKEKKKHEKDYYEEVSNQLEKTEKILSRIEKEEDRLIGDKARANQNKQLSNLAKEIELQKEKQKIQQRELKDVDALIKKNDKLAEKTAAKQGIITKIPDPWYDEDGIIGNYEEISKAIDNTHNKLIEKYNAAAKAGNEKLTKQIQKTIDKFDKYGEDLLKNAQRHNKLQSEIEETTNALEDLKDQMEDIRIAAFRAHQEAIDDLKDLKEGAAELAVLFRDFDSDGFLTSWSLDETPIDDMIKSMYELDDIYNVSKEDANSFYQTIIDRKNEDLKNAKTKEEKDAIKSSIKYFQDQQKNLSEDDLKNGLLGLANQDVDKLKGWIDGTNKEPNPYGDNTAALWEDYKAAYERAIGLFKDWKNTVKELRDSIIDTYDEQEEAIERNLENYDRVLDHLERISDTYTLYYGEDSYDGIVSIMDRQGASMQQYLADLTQTYEYWSKRYEEALKTGNKEIIKNIEDKMNDAEKAMYDQAEELAEHWVKRFETAVDASIQKMTNKLWGGGQGQMDFEDQTMIWELQKDYMSSYKDDVEKAYEIDKLRSKYLDLLNDAQGMSLQTQNKIRSQMQEQLDLLNGQTTMSEYDVKLANAKLEILQKQIALEDAQRNKNKMQLRRDTQGNYRYVYTADQGDIKKAQDELNESEFDAYEITKEQTIANNDRAVNLYQDYMDKMRDIANKYKDDEVARAAAMNALTEEYKKLWGALGEDFQDTTKGMFDVLTWLVDNGTKDTATAAIDMLDQLYDKNGEVKENTGNDWRDFATEISEEIIPNIEEVVVEGLSNIEAEALNLKDQMTGDDGTLTKIGSSTDTLKESMDKALEVTEQWADATERLFESFSPDNKKVQEAMTQLKEMSKQLQANQSATSALSTKYKETNAALQSKTAEAEHWKTALDFSTGAKKVKQGTIVKLKKGTRVNYDRYGGIQEDTEHETGWKLPYDMWVKFGTPLSGVPKPYNFYATGESLKRFGKKQNNGKGGSDSSGGVAPTEERHHQTWWFDQQELQKNVLDAMDTGGYTGDWNEKTPLWKNGKIAMLHQKELVLNASDTQNILAAVSLMREVTKGTMMGLSNISNATQSGFSNTYSPTTEQRVEIQATFPNATDAEDIRTALLNLSDKAYQYAHRTI